MQDNKMREYAKLLVDVGLNVQREQTVRVQANVESAPFARLCVEAAYGRGCREVILDYKDDVASRMYYLHAADGVFDEYPAWNADKMNGLARGGFANLVIAGGDPEALKGADPDRIQRAQVAAHTALAECIEKQMKSEFPWAIGAVPTLSWARKVFPDKPDDEAMALLWDAIFAAVRVTGDGRAAERWEKHILAQRDRLEKLNSHAFSALHYRNGIGTDFTVELPENHIWLGGADMSGAGHRFVANMPTEELFTAPKWDSAEGTLASSMPFSLHGTVIDPFTFTFKKGKIVEIRAKTEEQHGLLEKAITTDDGASYLGEIALVSHSSPVNALGILFYNTLFDENAACHFAFGEAYASCIQGGGALSRDQYRAHGINDSKTHIDFMVGTPDLAIVGVGRDGRSVPVFVDGEFALCSPKCV